MKTVTLQFYLASDPPDDDRTVLCCDGQNVFTGWYESGDKLSGPGRYDTTAYPLDSVLAWADLPKARECVE